jgi:hypothetical protein
MSFMRFMVSVLGTRARGQLFSRITKYLANARNDSGFRIVNFTVVPVIVYR